MSWVNVDLESEGLQEFAEKIGFENLDTFKEYYYTYTVEGHVRAVFDGHEGESYRVIPQVTINQIYDVEKVLYQLYFLDSNFEKLNNVAKWNRVLTATFWLMAIGRNINTIQDVDGVDVDIGQFVPCLSRAVLKYRLKLPRLSVEEEANLERIARNSFKYYNTIPLLPHQIETTRICLKCSLPAVAE
jgi:hypothetical protein